MVGGSQLSEKASEPEPVPAEAGSTVTEPTATEPAGAEPIGTEPAAAEPTATGPDASGADSVDTDGAAESPPTATDQAESAGSDVDAANAPDGSSGDDAEATAAEPPEGQAEETQERSGRTHDIIFVGAKPIMTYVNATLTLIRSTPVVTLKARGRRIKQAVDVALTIVKRMSAVGYSIRDIRISSSPLDSLDGKTRNISTIEIEIQKSDS